MSDSDQEHSTMNAKKLPGSTGPNQKTSTPVNFQTAKAKFFDKLLQTAAGKEPLWLTIDNSLAHTINTIMRSTPDNTFDKDIFKGILQLGNCPGLSKITVNPSVWDRIPAEASTQDVKLQRVHNSMIKVASSFSYILNTLLENMSEDDGTLILSPENMESLLDKSLQAWSCFGFANFELVAQHRDTLHPHIASDFGHLCAQKTPNTDVLFEDDVTKQIKDIAEDNRLAGKLSLINNLQWKFSRGCGHGGHGRGRGQAIGGRFRGQGQGQFSNFQPLKASGAFLAEERYGNSHLGSQKKTGTPADK